jgi:hypothetical protein
MATHRCLGKQADTVVIEMWKPWSGVYPASSTHSGAELAAVEIDTSVERSGRQAGAKVA